MGSREPNIFTSLEAGIVNRERTRRRARARRAGQPGGRVYEVSMTMTVRVRAGSKEAARTLARVTAASLKIKSPRRLRFKNTTIKEVRQ